ncbi:MAG: hypothetical protein ABSB38_01255 [Dehalococcoidia bacterium]
MSEWTKPALDDIEFVKAVSAIQKRAEKQTDSDRLIDIYVTTDLANRARTTNSQLVLGRRGTGKTHMFRVLQEMLGMEGEVALYIDCRMLGSAITDSTGNPQGVAIKYFRTLLNEISTRLFDMARRMEAPIKDSQQKVFGTVWGLLLQIEPKSTEKYYESTFNYRQITESMQTIISGLDIRHLFIILDEWSQIPVSAQPYVAEYLKRAIMTIPEICIKLLALSYQCDLSKQISEGVIGIKLGADIPDVLDFDSYLIYDEKPIFVSEFFSQVLYNHLGAELNWDLKITGQEKSKRIIDIFTQNKAFTELVRAAEGNCRDFLCIFGNAYWEGYRKQEDVKAISMSHVRDAAASWFDNEKYANIRNDILPSMALMYIFNNLIKGYKSRTFMVETSKSKHEILTRLLNERVLHKLPRFDSHKDKPGERYELFTIDYGAYVRFIGTVYEPNQGMVKNGYQAKMHFADEVVTVQDEEQEFMVPHDDRRSVRRIVFDPDAIKIPK